MTKVKNGSLATKSTAKKKPGLATDNSKDEKQYRVLQQQVQSGIRLIDAALNDYYETNPHFPRNKKSRFFKWTIERNSKGAPVVNVFFRENCLPWNVSNLGDVKE